MSVLMGVALAAHPAMDGAAETQEQVYSALKKVRAICEQTASSFAKEQLSRVANVMVASCRCPTGTKVPGVADPRRFLLMLGRYWRLASELVQIQTSVQVGYDPHPLLSIIENLRDRIATCFMHLDQVQGAAEAARACDQLMVLLAAGEIDDLCAVPEWTSGELKKVELFITRAGMKLGDGGYGFTEAAKYFLQLCEHLIRGHRDMVRTMWKRIAAPDHRDGVVAGNAQTPDPSSPPSAKRRPRRTTGQIVEDQGKIGGHLAEHPEATRDEIAAATGIASAHVSKSKVWRKTTDQRKEARKANATKRGIGGVGDPTTDLGRDDN